jgi:hypothetical protein
MSRNSDIRNSTKSDDGKPLSAESTLLWERFHGPTQAAAQQLNAAISNMQNILGGIIVEKEGFTTETHIFDADRMRIIPRPPNLKVR